VAEPITIDEPVASSAEVHSSCSGGRLPHTRGRRPGEFVPTQVTAYYQLVDDGWRLSLVIVKGPIVHRDGQLGAQSGWATFGGHHDPVPDWLRPWVERNNPGRGGVSGG
jgi:hypothetical protein